MGDDKDGTGGEGGDGRRGWPADYRVALAEPLVEFKGLEGRMEMSEARTETVFERVETSIARLGKDAAERDAKAAERDARAAAAAAERDAKAIEAIAERDVEAAKRENRIVKWVVGSVAVATGVIGVVVSLAIGLLHLLSN